MASENATSLPGQSNAVDQQRVDSLKKSQYGGPEIGRAFVIDRETNEKVPVSVRAEKDGLHLEVAIFDPNERNVGRAVLRDYSEADLRQDEVSKSAYHPNHERLHYGNDKNNKYQPNTYVESMQTHGTQYKGVGKLMHQIAAERSFQTGGEGRVQLKVGSIQGGMSHTENPATSAGFHESFGFRGQDVYNADGSLHHKGQEMHEKLATEAFGEAQLNKKIGAAYPDSGTWPPQGGIQKSPATFMDADRPAMYLPDDVIAREKARMEKEPILNANDATIQELIKKDNRLARDERKGIQSEDEEGLPESPESIDEPAYPGTNASENWKAPDNQSEYEDADESPVGKTRPEGFKEPNNKSEYESKDETPVGKNVPADFKAPEPEDERTGMEKLGHDAGRGAGDLKNKIDSNYDRLQAEQSARQAERGGAKQGGGKGADAKQAAGQAKVDGLGGGAKGGVGAGGSGSAKGGAGSAGKGGGSAGASAGATAGGASAGAGAAKGGAGKGAGIRQGIDQAKDQLQQAGDQAGGKAGEGINKAVQAVDKIEQTVDKTATGLMVAVYVILAWLVLIGSVTFLFSTGFLGAILGIFPLISPKYSYKIIVWILDLFGIGEFLEMAIDANNIKLTPLEKIITGINAFLVLAAWVILFGGMLLIMAYSICKVATTGATGYVASAGAFLSDTFTGTNLGGALSFCSSLTGAIENATGLGGGGGNTGNGTPAGSVKEYAALINKAAADNNIEYCALEALVLKESGGKSNVYSSKDGVIRYIDTSNPDKKTYGLSFTDGYGHGIGLIQIFIYSKPRSDAVWLDSSTPSRKGDEFGKPGGYLTVTDLLDPATNLNAGAAYFAKLLRRHNGDVKEAYRAYQGAGSAQATIDKYYQYYQECKARQ